MGIIPLMKFKCYECGARLADIEPSRSIVEIKCFRCNAMNSYYPSSPRFVVGNRILDIGKQVFGTAMVMA